MSLPKELKRLREEIDQVDKDLLKALSRRAAVAEKIGKLKKKLNQDSDSPLTYYDPEREKVILDQLECQKPAQFAPGATSAIFREIIGACRELQKPDGVAFLGPEGTHTHVAADRQFGLSVEYLECPTIEAVFTAVETGRARFGVVPIENSTEGGVAETLSCLMRHGPQIISEKIEVIHHYLASSLESLSGVQRVYSHPQALSQCQNWLKKNMPHAQLVVTNSTSEAASKALEDTQGGAICSQLAAEMRKLKILGKKIEDQSNNATRFVVLGSESPPPTGNDRTSIALSAKDESGSLVQILQVFQNADINLSRIESKSSRQAMWEYVFFIDLEGHIEDQKTKAAMKDLSTFCGFVKNLGSYPRADRES